MSDYLDELKQLVAHYSQLPEEQWLPNVKNGDFKLGDRGI